MKNRVLLVGWDSAEWSILQGLADAGQAPNFSRFLESGSAGKLRTLYPTQASLLWTSIASGKAADQHGILSERLPATSRRAKTLWNITSERDLRTHVIGWPVTHPAEKVEGICVTPGFFGTSKDLDSLRPRDDFEALRDLRLELADIPIGSLLELVPQAKEIKQRYDDRLTKIAHGLATLCSAHNVATWILENKPWDFAAVHYHPIAYFSKYFMPFHPPQRRDVTAENYNFYKDVVTGIYRLSDLMLGRLMELAGPDCTVVLVSDHGYESGSRRPSTGSTNIGGAEAWHTAYGFIAMLGNGIAKDNLVHGGTLLDVAPTVLTLLGLPVGDDMDGKVLLDAFEEDPKMARIPSWEEQPRQSDQPVDSVGARGVAEHFIAFDRLDQQKAGGEDATFNLVSIYMSSGRPGLALPLIKELASAAPENLRYQRSLIQCYLSTGSIADAEELLHLLLSGHEKYGWMHFLHGVILMHSGQVDEALKAFEQASEDPSAAPFVPAFAGNVYLAKGFIDKAEQSYQAALKLDSENAEAFVGMAAVRLNQRRLVEAADCALRAVNIHYELPNAHFQLGLALVQLGQREKARAAFEATLKLAPYLSSARDQLERLAKS